LYQNGLNKLGIVIAVMLLSRDVFIKKCVWLLSIDLTAFSFVVDVITLDVINSKLMYLKTPVKLR